VLYKLGEYDTSGSLKNPFSSALPVTYDQTTGLMTIEHQPTSPAAPYSADVWIE